LYGPAGLVGGEHCRGRLAKFAFGRLEDEMVKDLDSFSARAEKIRKPWRRLAALAVGSSLWLMPFAAYGHDGETPAPNAAAAFERIALPPIPYLDTMPWLGWDQKDATMKVDTLLSPVLGPSGIKLDPTSAPDRQQPAMS
jgi:hypothetical protein